jgi:DNA-directed RNA polymerase specialized sigma24 family protein
MMAMASGLAMSGTLRHLRDLFHDGTAVGLGDGQLLARYAADRDEAAFAALVARHGPMVLATCRAVLRHEPDVEDAFQATFLVLARKARTVRAGEALGGWLHRVAYRVALEASVRARRRRRRNAQPARSWPSLRFASWPGISELILARSAAAGSAG